MVYWNYVFDLTYFKITYGKNYWIKFLNPFSILKKIVFWYYGLSLLTIKLVLNIVKLKNLSIFDFLFQSFNRPFDDRIIVKINNEWICNSGKKIFLESIKEIVPNLSTNKLNWMIGRFDNLYDKTKELSMQTTTYKALFTNQKTKTVHNIYTEISNNSKIVGYQTSYKTAYDNNFYNLSPMINKYNGPLKTSTILPYEYDSLLRTSKDTKEIYIKQITGAIKHGYDEKQLSKKYLISIENIKDIESEITSILGELNINDNEIKLILLNKMIDNTILQIDNF